MGFYYGNSQPPKEKEPGGCRDVLVLTRVVFGVLFWPLAVMIGVIIGLVLVIYLWSIFWLLGVLALVLIGAGVGLYAHWERGRYRA
jgi:hypothetical protein